MKISRLIIAFSLMTVVAASASNVSANLSGRWKFQGSGSGRSVTMTLELQQAENRLTGTVTGPRGRRSPIEEGVVNGKSLSFTVASEDASKVVHVSGELKDERLALTFKTPRGDVKGTAKRVH